MTFSDTFAVRNHQSSHMHSIITSCLPILTTLFLSAPPSDEPVTATPDSIPEQILEEVVVKARRPQVIVTPEKISFNPSATLAGSNGTLYDALSSMPGVSVNGSTISAFGQSGVTLTVDGRKFMLQGNALESYLKSLPVSNIERIELVTAPAARSDASSSSTVLNVKLRRTRQAGMTFGASANLQGWRARRGLGTAFFNYSNARTSVMLSAAYALSRNPSVLLTDRPYLDGDLRILQTYHRYRTDRNKNTSVYIDHNFSGRWSGGLSFSGNRFNRSECGLMDTRLSDDSRGNHTVNHTRLGSSNLSGGLYLKDTFEDHRGNLSIGFDYFSSCNDESQDISDTFGTATEGEMNGSVRGYITTVDFTRQLSEPWFLSAGAKSTILRIGNEGNYNESGGGDDDLSSRFRGHENVNAIYMESRFAPAPVLALTAGIRLEQTNVRNRFSGNETSGQSDFSRHSAGIFCNVNLSSRLTDRDAVMLSYVRRVKRPDYSDLNPFVYIMDDITHYGGNINLREATSDNFRLVYTRDNLLRCGLSYSYINNDIVRFFREVAGKTVYSSPENIPAHHNATLTVSAMNIPVTSWWDISGTLAAVYNSYLFNPDLDMAVNRSLSPMCDIRCRFDPIPSWGAELALKWQGRTAYGQTELSPTGSLYIGVRYTLPGDKVNIILFGKDILNTNYRRNRIRLHDRVSTLQEREFEDMRQIGLSFSYRFSSGKSIHKKRENKAQDEINRVNL